jgi:hypothetical protein
MTTEEEISQLKQRISFLEGQVSVLQHELDKKGIIKPNVYPPYIPWTSPVVVPSDNAPYKWLSIKTHSGNPELNKTS